MHDLLQEALSRLAEGELDFSHVKAGYCCTFVCVCHVLGRFMDRGKFVPDQIIFKVLVTAIERAKGRGKHILLDGFPR